MLAPGTFSEKCQILEKFGKTADALASVLCTAPRSTCYVFVFLDWYRGDSSGNTPKGSAALRALVEAGMYVSAPSPTTESHAEICWGYCILDVAFTLKTEQSSVTPCGEHLSDRRSDVLLPTLTPRMTMFRRRSSCMRTT